MRPDDDATYGFNRVDAEDLLQSIGSREEVQFNRSQGSSGRATALQHFILIEDQVGLTIQGRKCNPSGGGVDSEETPTNLVNWAGLLDGAKTGYVGLYAKIGDDWVFVQGPCIVPDEE